MKLRLPWQKATESAPAPSPAACTHPRVEVEMHGTAIKRRWCAICGTALAVPNRAT